MSLNIHSTSEVLGGPLSEDVVNQLNLRAEILGQDYRTEEELQLLNSQTIWVRMISSVDNSDVNDMASRNVLLGGTLSNGKLQGGILNEENSGYELDSNFGYRPKAGITAFAVSPKNLYGTLRTATVEFQVSSPDQFDELEQLFLRPGFSVLLEWGHSFYVTETDGNRDYSGSPDTFDRFLNGSGLGMRRVTNELNKIKENSQYNYDGLHGMVKNFTWSFAEGGGYNCQVELVSYGEVIESIQVGISAGTSESGNSKVIKDTINENEGDKKKDLEDLLGRQSTLIGRELLCISQASPTTLQNSNIKYFDSKLPPLDFGKSEEEDNYSLVNHRFITLGHLLSLVNRAYMLKDSSDSEITKFNTKAEDRYLTFGEHHSGDPYKFVIPKKRKEGKFGFESNNTTVGGVNIPDIGFLNQAGTRIVDLYITVDYVQRTLKFITEKNNTNVQSVYDFVKLICDDMTAAFGHINFFDIVYNEDTQLHHIVDRRTVPPKADPLPVLSLYGRDSIAENVNLSTKLTNSITTMLAISAQASNTNAGFDMLNMQQWNKGLRDRHLPVKKVEKGGKVEPDTSRFEGIATDLSADQDKLPFFRPFLSDLTNYNKFVDNTNKYLNTANQETVGAVQIEYFTKEEVAQVAIMHKAIMQDRLRKRLGKKSGAKPGLIPFELSFQTRGISGIKIGQAFRIDDSVMLPERYRNKVAFVVTGVEHSADTNRWVTRIQALMIVR